MDTYPARSIFNVQKIGECLLLLLLLLPQSCTGILWVHRWGQKEATMMSQKEIQIPPPPPPPPPVVGPRVQREMLQKEMLRKETMKLQKEMLQTMMLQKEMLQKETTTMK